MSLARQHRERILAMQTASAPALEGGFALDGPPDTATLDAGSPAERAAAQVAMRLQHDLRRLKEVQSIERRIEIKRELLPEYQAWLDGLLAGDAQPTGVAAEVLPVCMVWSIDTGDWPRALQLAAHVIEREVPMPGRYKRRAAVLVAEEIAEVANKAQNANEAFPLDVLQQVEALTTGHDMPDEVRAKLVKALGVALAGHAETLTGDQLTTARSLALGVLQRAQSLNGRIGVKDRIKRLEKALAAPVVTEQVGEQPAA